MRGRLPWRLTSVHFECITYFCVRNEGNQVHLPIFLKEIIKGNPQKLRKIVA